MNKQKQSEFNIVESANKIKKLIEQKQSWEERFDEEFQTSPIRLPKEYVCIPSPLAERTKQFISQEIQKATAEADRKAREEERERIIKEANLLLIDSPDMACHYDCSQEGYEKGIEDVINIINK